MKRIIQNFEDFAGIDYRATDLTRERQFYKSCKNYQYGEGSSLVGRFGSRMDAGPMGIYKIHNYKYFDEDTGETVEELIGIGAGVFRLKTESLTLARDTSGGIASAAFEVNMKENYGIITLYEDGSPITWIASEEDGVIGYGIYNPFVDPTFTGAEVSTVWDLAVAVNAVSGWSMDYPSKSAKFAGNMAGGTNGTIDFASTIANGNYVAFPEYSTVGEPEDWYFGRVRVRSGASITFYRGVYTRNNQVIGPGAASTASLKKGMQSITPGSSIEIEYSYWEPVISEMPNWFGGELAFNGGSAPKNIFQNLFESVGTDDFEHPNVTNAQQSAYICHARRPEAAAANVAVGQWQGYPFKYDGHSLYRAGMPPMKTPVSTTLVGSGSLTGTYKYALRWVHVDYRGIRTEGNPNSIYPEYQIEVSPSSENVTLEVPNPMFCVPREQIAYVNGNQSGVTSATVDTTKNIKSGDLIVWGADTELPNANDLTGVTASELTGTTVALGDTYDLVDNDPIYINPHLGLKHGGAVVDGNQSGVNTIDVDGTSLDIHVGDQVILYDGNQGIYTVRNVTAWTQLTITIDGAAVDVLDNAYISRNVFLEIYRTEAGGSIYYFVGIAPASPYLRISYTDSMADADLGIPIIEPAIGREHDMPPKAKFATPHQSSLTYGGDPGNPNSISPGDYDNVEYVPATKRLDIPSAQTGPITAAFSDSDDRLAVFKDNGYYDVQGDLLLGQPVAIPVTEGDYGVSSQSSLAKVSGYIFGVGQLGPVIVRNGQLINDISNKISPAFFNNSDLLYSRSVGINDSTTRQYICYIPKLSTITDNGDDGEFVFAYDYEQGAWFDLSYQREQAPSGGMAVYDGKLYSCCLYNWDSEDETGYSTRYFARGYVYHKTDFDEEENHRFWDIMQGIDYLIIPQPYHLGEPSVNKEFHSVKIWSVPTQFDEDVVAFDMTITLYKDFVTSTPYGDTIDLSFAATDVEKSHRLPADKFRALELQLLTQVGVSSIGRARISGIEVIVKEVYGNEDFLP